MKGFCFVFKMIENWVSLSVNGNELTLRERLKIKPGPG